MLVLQGNPLEKNVRGWPLHAAKASKDKVHFYADLENLVEVQPSLEGEERLATCDEEVKPKNTTFLTHLRSLSSDAYKPPRLFQPCA